MLLQLLEVHDPQQTHASFHATHTPSPRAVRPPAITTGTTRMPLRIWSVPKFLERRAFRLRYVPMLAPVDEVHGCIGNKTPVVHGCAEFDPEVFGE